MFISLRVKFDKGFWYSMDIEKYAFLLLSIISQLIRFAGVCSNVDDFNNRNLFLTAKLLKLGYKFYHRQSELC